MYFVGNLAPSSCALSPRNTAKWLFLVVLYSYFSSTLPFSLVKIGLGFPLIVFGIFWFLYTFRRNLHSMKEQPKTKNSYIFRYFSSLFLIFFCILILFAFIIVLCQFFQLDDLHILHIHEIFNTTVCFVFVPKYYINHDPNLKFYVSVYHHQPPPVLPWQLPKIFDPNSVKLICVKQKKE